jgi:hypothetical protein
MKLFSNPTDWFAELDRCRQGSFLEGVTDRNQPITPCRDAFDDHLLDADETIN